MADAADSIHQIRTKPDLKTSIEAQADAEVTSASEITRRLMDDYIGVHVDDAADTPRLSERLSIWVSPDRWLAFTTACKERGHTFGQALEIAAERVL